jgi:hypothetical protein
MPLKPYLKDLCRDFSMMLSSGRAQRIVVVEGIEIELPTVTAVPLGFIANPTDHKRSQIRRRPDHGQLGGQSGKRLRAVGF